MDSTIQIIVRQAGSAYSFIPVLQELSKLGISYDLLCVSTHNAAPILKHAGIKFSEAANFSEAEKHLNRKAKILLSGTSEVSHDDFPFWDWAKENKISSIGYVDQWLSWWERFTYPVDFSKRFNHTPDHIFVVDEFSKKQMLDIGCSPEKLSVVGNPAFDDKIQSDPHKLCAIDELSEYKILFVSDPYKLDHPNETDFDESLALERLAKIVKKLLPQGKKGLRIALRPHPLEIAERVKERLDRLQKIHPELYLDTEPKFDSLKHSSCVVGMSSVLVFESYLMGKPSACYLSPVAKANPYTLATKGIPICRSEQALEEFLKATFFQPEKLKSNFGTFPISTPIFLKTFLSHYNEAKS